MTEKPVRVLATFHVKADQVDAFISLMSGLCEPTRAEPGCISYELQQSKEDPTVFVCVEEWASEADIGAHVGSPHVQQIGPSMRAMLSCPLEVKRYKPLWFVTTG